MSSTLIARPMPIGTTSFDDALKFILREEYGDPVNTTLGSGDFDYLRGLRDAQVPGADKLFKLLHEEGELTLKEEF